MAQEKLFTARQAADAVLKKTQELLAKSEFFKAEKGKNYPKDLASANIEQHMKHKDKHPGGAKQAIAIGIEQARRGEHEKSEQMNKGETENAKKENAKPSEHGAKDASQHAEGKGPKGEIHPKEKEQAPSDEVRGQAAPEKNPKEQAEGNNELAGTTPTQVGQDGKNIEGFDEMKGHLKLAKFIGHMESKRKMKAGVPNG